MTWSISACSVRGTIRISGFKGPYKLHVPYYCRFCQSYQICYGNCNKKFFQYKLYFFGDEDYLNVQGVQVLFVLMYEDNKTKVKSV